MQTLTSDQLADLAAAICATAETLGQTVSASAAQLMAQDLAEYPAKDVGNALRACRRELTGRLTLAAIIQRVQAVDGRPARDEAWSIALAGTDEFETVVMTEEIQKAMSAATPILEAGDKVGARMAFMSAYDRHVDDARRENRPVSWSVSLGFDPDRRKVAVERAVLSGLLPAPKADEELVRLGFGAPETEDGKSIAGLITGRVSMPSPKVKEKLDGIRCVLEASGKEKAAAKKAARQAQVHAHERRMEEQLAALAELKNKKESVNG